MVRQLAHSCNEARMGHWVTCPCTRPKKLQDVNGKPQARVNAVVHVISAPVVDDVNVVVITPTYWPRLHEAEVVAAVREAMPVIVAAIHMEAVSTAKTCAVMSFRNSAMRTVVSAAMVLRRCM